MHEQKNVHFDYWNSISNFLFKCDLPALHKKESELIKKNGVKEYKIIFLSLGYDCFFMFLGHYCDLFSDYPVY
jgi:hypothetical protein